MTFPRIQAETPRAPGGPNLQATQQALGSLRSRLAAFTSELEAEADQRAIRRGTTAGAAEGTKEAPEFRDEETLFAQAFNKAALSAYTATIEADVTRDLAVLKEQHKNDPEAYAKIARGYASGTLSGIDPRARASAGEFLARKIGDDLAELQIVQVKIDREKQVAAYSTGLEIERREILTLSQNKPNDIDQIVSRIDNYAKRLSEGIDGGLISAKDATTAMKELSVESDKSLIRGTFQEAYKRGQGAQFLIELNARDLSASFDPDEKRELQTELAATLSQLQRLDANELELERKERERVYQQGEREATELFLAGGLSREWIRNQQEADRLDPAFARTMTKEIGSGGPAFDDDERRLIVETDILNYTETEIATDQALTFDTRRQLIEKRRKLEEDTSNWRNKQSGQEGARRIRGEFGVINGQLSLLDPDMAKRASRALTRYYDEIDALPIEQREIKAVEVANRIIREDKDDKIEDEIDRLQSKLSGMDSSDEDDLQRQLDDTLFGKEEIRVKLERIRRLKNRIAELERKRDALK